MQQKEARFITGSTWRHVILMTLTNSIGLTALFLVDLIDLYFLNLLGEQEMAASVGFSAQILFYITAMSIGLLVAVGILVSQHIGAQNTKLAKQIVASSLVIATVLLGIISAILLFYLEDILTLLGAKGRTFDLSLTYARIVLPSSVILVIGMVLSAVLRGLGDARRSMSSTLVCALVNLIFDPLLIFYFDMGISGAAWASVLARIAMLCYCLYSVVYIHKMLAMPKLKNIFNDFLPIAKLAGPALLTNLATPIGSTFVIREVSHYGDSAVAAYATIGRIIPVAFSVLFALSGAISPIIGQNFGAKKYRRVSETYRNSVIFAVGIVILVSAIIFIGRYHLLGLFNLSGEASQLLMLFCSGLTLFFIADGILFSTNSVFNSLGHPLYSTLFNYAKFFLGIIPSVYILSHFYGAKGVMIGQGIGPVLISIVAFGTCRRMIGGLKNNSDDEDPHPREKNFTNPLLWPTSSAKTQI